MEMNEKKKIINSMKNVVTSSFLELYKVWDYYNHDKGHLTIQIIIDWNIQTLNWESLYGMVSILIVYDVSW